MKNQGSANNSVMAANNESCFATPGSIFAIVDKIHWAIASAKHNKAYVLRFVPVIKQITKVLNGADVKFIRQAEFYSDLKETLFKIENHVKESSTRGKWMNKLMAKKNQKSFEEFEEHVDHLITRIVFSFAQRVQLLNLARQKKRALSEIREEDDESEISNESASSTTTCDTSGERVSLASQEDDIDGER
ncbi:uncharacterized protein LOC144638670 [Oculina patagonica]